MYRFCYFGTILALSCLVCTYQSQANANSIQKPQKILLTQINEQSRKIQILEKRVDAITAKKQISIEKSPIIVKISGQLNQALLYSSDGEQNKLFFVTNENSNSRAKLSGEYTGANGITVGGHVELGFKINSSDAVSQNMPTPSSSIDMRKVEFYAGSKRLGKVWLGKGCTASDGTAEVDLSGTDVVAYSAIEKLGGALYFRSNASSAYSGNPQIGDIFDNMDGFGRKNRIRYDSPSLFGFSLATSAIENNSSDVALKFNNTLKGIKLAGSAAYTSSQALNDTYGNVFDGSFSMLLPAGLNATVAGGRLKSRPTGRNNPNYYYAKIGLLRKYCGLGKTALSADYGRSNNYAQNNDVGKTYGVDIVQNITAWSSAFYAGYRRFTLNRIDVGFKAINTVVVGGIFKFDKNIT